MINSLGCSKVRGVERVTYASCPWGCEGLWVEQTHAVAKALVLHSAEDSYELLLSNTCVVDEHEERVGEDLKVNWSARGGETAGEVEGGGGEEERGELLWVA